MEIDNRRRTRVRNNVIRGWRDTEAVKKHSGNILMAIFFGPLFTFWIFAVMCGIGLFLGWLLNYHHF